ncbi:MAG: hypothetical protein HXY25_05855 [Alphaproteobacteria bacterium]|nr:hypothetical protein [Alphaproteobacteria bacterium]
MRLFMILGGVVAVVAFFLPWFHIGLGVPYAEDLDISAFKMWQQALDCSKSASPVSKCVGVSERDVYLVGALAAAGLALLFSLVRIPGLSRLMAVIGGIATLVAVGWVSVSALDKDFTLGYGLFAAAVGGVLLIFGGLAAHGR